MADLQGLNIEHRNNGQESKTRIYGNVSKQGYIINHQIFPVISETAKRTEIDNYKTAHLGGKQKWLIMMLLLWVAALQG